VNVIILSKSYVVLFYRPADGGMLAVAIKRRSADGAGHFATGPV